MWRAPLTSIMRIFLQSWLLVGTSFRDRSTVNVIRDTAITAAVAETTSVPVILSQLIRHLLRLDEELPCDLTDGSSILLPDVVPHGALQKLSLDAPERDVLAITAPTD